MARWTSPRLIAAFLAAAAPIALVAAFWSRAPLPSANVAAPPQARIPAARDDDHTASIVDEQRLLSDESRAARDEAAPQPGTQASLGPDVTEEPEPMAGPQADRLTLTPPDPQVAILRTVLDFYRKGDLVAGDVAARALPDGDAKLLAEWLAIRLAPRGVGFERVVAFMEENPEFPSQAMLRRRAEEALLAERRTPKEIKAHFAARPPVTIGGRLALARILASEGRAREAGEMIRETWRREEFSAEFEARILTAFPKLLAPLDHRLRAERFLAREDWTAAMRNAQRAGEDVVRITRARIAAEKVQGDAEKLLDALPKALQADASAVLGRAAVLRRKDKGPDAAKLLAALPQQTAGVLAQEAEWEERRALARRLIDRNEPTLAYEVAAGMRWATGATRVDAEFHAGWIALRFLDKPEPAALHFAAAAAEATTAISISRAAYWQGRAEEALGRPAQPHFERAAAHATTYYGQLARSRLGLRDMPVRRVEAAAEGTPGLPALRLLYAAGRAISPSHFSSTSPSEATTPPRSPPPRTRRRRPATRAACSPQARPPSSADCRSTTTPSPSAGFRRATFPKTASRCRSSSPLRGRRAPLTPARSRPPERAASCS